MILLTVYDLFIWIYRLFFRREIHLQGRLKVMKRELKEQWPYNDLCLNHINEEENEHLMKGKINSLVTIEKKILFSSKS